MQSQQQKQDSRAVTDDKGWFKCGTLRVSTLLASHFLEKLLVRGGFKKNNYFSLLAASFLCLEQDLCLTVNMKWYISDHNIWSTGTNSCWVCFLLKGRSGFGAIPAVRFLFTSPVDKLQKQEPHFQQDQGDNSLPALTLAFLTPSKSADLSQYLIRMIQLLTTWWLLWRND